MAILLTSFIGLLVIGIPIAIVLAGSGLAYVVLATDVPLTLVPQRMFVGIDNFILTSIPLFILAGYLMNASGITERLVRFATILLRPVYAGLAQANVAVSMTFGGLSGVAAADVAAVGTVMIPAMEREGYSRGYATALTLAGSLMGPVFPPSVPLIIYGVQSEQSIGDLFLAGAIPGVMIGLSLIAYNYVALKRQGFQSPQRNEPFPGLVEFARAFGAALVGIVMPVVIIGGIVGGIFTPTEAAGVAVAYALVAGMAVFRTLTVRALPQVFVKAAITSAVVMIIVVTSEVLNWVLAYSQIPLTVADAFLGLTDDKAVFLVLVVALLLLVGIPLDPVPALIIITPVLLPAAELYDIDLVHFGVVMVMTLVLGLLTPPVGASLFVASAITRLSIGQLSVIVLPFLAVLTVLTLVVAFVPEFSLTLPDLLGDK